jgi:hypothetical protein
MNRRKLLLALFGVGPLTTVCLLAKDQGRGKSKGRNNKENQQGDDQGDDRGSHHFRHEDYGVVQRYYTGPRDLPPGLRKKYYRTNQLPPGWQKRLQPFPPELVRVLPPPPPNCERGYIDGVAVVYDRRTRIILDSIDLIGAIVGH